MTYSCAKCDMKTDDLNAFIEHDCQASHLVA